MDIRSIKTGLIVTSVIEHMEIAGFEVIVDPTLAPGEALFIPSASFEIGPNESLRRTFPPGVRVC